MNKSFSCVWIKGSGLIADWCHLKRIQIQKPFRFCSPHALPDHDHCLHMRKKYLKTGPEVLYNVEQVC